MKLSKVWPGAPAHQIIAARGEQLELSTITFEKQLQILYHGLADPFEKVDLRALV